MYAVTFNFNWLIAVTMEYSLALKVQQNKSANRNNYKTLNPFEAIADRYN